MAYESGKSCVAKAHPIRELPEVYAEDKGMKFLGKPGMNVKASLTKPKMKGVIDHRGEFKKGK